MSITVTAVYSYSGTQEDLLAAVLHAIQKMNLIKKNEYKSDNSFSIEASEKMKWLSTSWPVNFKIESAFVNGISKLTVLAESESIPVTQERLTQAKADEFIDLVKAFAPNTNPPN